jgi:uncharacterized protein (DUF433 family)
MEKKKSEDKKKTTRIPGLDTGSTWVSDDFVEPLPDSFWLMNRITTNPDIMLGKPIIRGRRITVEQILMALSAGVPAHDLLEDYPELEPEDLQAVFAFVAISSSPSAPPPSPQSPPPTLPTPAH